MLKISKKYEKYFNSYCYRIMDNFDIIKLSYWKMELK